jgi:hypothetical protein
MLWGILSSDYATQASYYATKKACEPLHVQLDLATNDVHVINTTRNPLPRAKVYADVYALDGKLLLHREATLDATSDDVTQALHLDLAPLLGDTTVLVHLALHSRDGALLSENLYWRAASDAGYRALNSMASADVALTVEDASAPAGSPGRSIIVPLKNTSAVAALNIKLTAVYTRNTSGESAEGGAIEEPEVLPAFYSDNYISLLPGEQRTVTIDLPRADSKRAIRVRLRGWNLTPAIADVGQPGK